MVVFDSAYGNTEKIARAIGEALGSRLDVEIHRVSDIRPESVVGSELLLVGSPTQGFRPTKPVAEFLKRLRVSGLAGTRVAAFDTRFKAQEIRSGALRLLVRTGGFAAERIAAQLKKAGGNLIVSPEGFFVEDTEGPLKPGELERAAEWARSILGAA